MLSLRWRRCRRVLPAVVDVGTDNTALQNLDLYLGLHQPRVTDQHLYMEVMDEVGPMPNNPEVSLEVKLKLHIRRMCRSGWYPCGCRVRSTLYQV